MNWGKKLNLNLKKYFGIKIIGALIFFVVPLLLVFAEDVEISITILPGQITYGAPSSLDLGNVPLGVNEQSLSGRFDDYFWVDDMIGSDDGYSAKIVCDGLFGPYDTILTGIYLMAGNGDKPERFLGVTGGVIINPVFSGSFYSIYSTPVTYIHRPLGQNFGRINKYGDRPWIKVVIPGYTTPGAYSGVIYFDM